MAKYCTVYPIGCKVTFIEPTTGRDAGHRKSGTIRAITIHAPGIQVVYDVETNAGSTFRGLGANDLSRVSSKSFDTCSNFDLKYALDDAVIDVSPTDVRQSGIGRIERIRIVRQSGIGIKRGVYVFYSVRYPNCQLERAYLDSELNKVETATEVMTRMRAERITRLANEARLHWDTGMIGKIGPWGTERITLDFAGKTDDRAGEAPLSALRRNEYVALPMRDTKPDNDGGFDWQVVFIDLLGKVLAQPYYDIPGRIAAEHLAAELNNSASVKTAYPKLAEKIWYDKTVRKEGFYDSPPGWNDQNTGQVEPTKHTEPYETCMNRRCVDCRVNRAQANSGQQQAE